MAKQERPSNMLVLIGIAGLIELVLGLWMKSAACLGGGAVAVCAAAISFRMQERSSGALNQTGSSHLGNSVKDKRRPAHKPTASDLALPRKEAADTTTLVDEMLAAGRFALLLRPQIIGNLSSEQLDRARAALDDTMCLVPTGPVQICLNTSNARDEDDWPEDSCGLHNDSAIAGRIILVDAYFIDRHAVTNAQYQQFVHDGGYEQMAIWEAESLPALLDFVDRTGVPGPRFWEHGTYLSGEAKLPVVGVSWYEALAYARWAGKRLPTDAEWVKTGAWPVESSPGILSQRRFPWGESFDASCANIWGSGPDRLVPVDQFTDGTSVGGVEQLIGNTWEWTSTPFGSADDVTLRLPTPMKAIRGGAFDTYFENQATCQFQSGENPLARRHNIGFRLAIGVCDLAPKATGLFPDDADAKASKKSIAEEPVAVVPI